MYVIYNIWCLRMYMYVYILYTHTHTHTYQRTLTSTMTWRLSSKQHNNQCPQKFSKTQHHRRNQVRGVYTHFPFPPVFFPVFFFALLRFSSPAYTDMGIVCLWCTCAVWFKARPARAFLYACTRHTNRERERERERENKHNKHTKHEYRHSWS